MKADLCKRFAVLIAAYNEEERLRNTVVAASLVPGVVGVIVANDGSKDQTASVATRAGALVASSKKNRGKGEALELAAATLEQVRPFGALDGVLLLDGDLGKSAEAAEVLLQPLVAGEADLVIGILPTPAKKAGFGLAKSLARDGIAEFGGGFSARAPLSGQRALTLECLSCVRPFASGYGAEVAMTICALQAQQRVVEIPVEMTHRATGRNPSGFLHRGKQFMALYHLLNAYSKQSRQRKRA